MKDYIAEVIVDSPIRTLDRIFHYEIPPMMDEEVKIGVRVTVPFGFGNKRMNGYVIGRTDHTDLETLKPIHKVIDKTPIFNMEIAQLAVTIRNRYCSTYAEAFKLFIPPGTTVKYLEYVALLPMDETEREEKIKRSAFQEQIVDLLNENGGRMEYFALKEEMKREIRSFLTSMKKKGVVEIKKEAKTSVQEKHVTVYRYSGDVDVSDAIGELEGRFPAQCRVLELLSQCECLSAPDIMAFSECSRSVLDTLERKGLIEREEMPVFRRPLSSEQPADSPKPPTEEQKTVLAEISQAVKQETFTTFLLHGVTGSGKTEVFLQTIDSVLSQGKTAIVLVPEIALTPQMTARFLARFGNRIAILHSALSLGERLDEWKRIQSGEARIVVGARSAIFAPVTNLGVIIMDEEHETTYKSENAPRYHAREIARMRGKQNHCPVILASATPSIESYYRAEQGMYRLLSMKKRYNDAPLPEVEIVDLSREFQNGNKTAISERLEQEIRDNLARREQTILFMNRRGYSTFVSCRDCGEAMMCPDCNISLTYHQYTNTLNCHYCGYRTPNPSVCPACGSKHIRYFGMGTQKIEEDLHTLFPEASVLRMDMDTTAKKNGHEKILQQFDREQTDILLGTQMVSKGLDFPNVTLVGVLAADALLNIDDFRAGERTFDLITQVCGRAGRGDKAGRAVIQTYTPEHPVLNKAKMQDYQAFYEEEINFRKLFCYPPFCDIIHLSISAKERAAAEKAVITLSDMLRKKLRAYGKAEQVQVMGPSEAPISRIKSRYRMRIWMKTRADDTIRRILHELLEMHYKHKTEVTFMVDINPNSMY